MTTIPDNIVQSTWRAVATIDPRVARSAMEKFTARQPALIAYVTASTNDSRSDVQEVAIFLLFVIYRMFEQLPGHQIKRISIDKLERRMMENEALIERLAQTDDSAREHEIEAQAASQPHVVQYLIEAIQEHTEPELTEDESALIFHVLKTVIDVLDSACKKIRWR